MSELEAQFRQATKNRTRHAEWRCAIDFPARYILREARCADLIVSGGDRGALSDPCGTQSERSGDASRPATADGPRHRQLVRLAKRSGGVEGHFRGEAGDRQFAAHAPKGQERYRRGDIGGGRQPAGGGVAGPRRCGVAVTSRCVRPRTRGGEGWTGRDRSTGRNSCRRRRRRLSRAPMVIRDFAN